MKYFMLIIALAFPPFLSACSSTTVTAPELNKEIRNFDEKTVDVKGTLCIDVTSFYLSSSEQCEDFDNATVLPLVASKEGQAKLRKLESPSCVIVRGVLQAPPDGAIVFQKGILLGSHLKVISIKGDQRCASGSP